MAEVDIAKIRYSCVAVLSGGGQVELSNIATNLAWEENESELATRLNLTIRDVDNGGRISQQIALCTAILVYYDVGSGMEEAFRGTVWDWEHPQVNNEEIVITGYDMLYYLQKSDDYKYYEAGMSTMGICSDILSSWSVPIGKLSGPSITHEKIAYKTKKISAMLKETLEEARKKTGQKYVIRADKGKCDIITPGTNSEIWTFSADTNLSTIKDRFSMDDLITKVKILGKDDKNGAKRPPVLATETGATQYGTLQKIITADSSKLDEAKAEAAAVLSDYGSPKHTITLLSPDFPKIRKGDKIRVVADKIDGYYNIRSISHNATSRQMRMEAEPA